MQLASMGNAAHSVPFVNHNVKMTVYKGPDALATRRAVANGPNEWECNHRPLPLADPSPSPLLPSPLLPSPLLPSPLLPSDAVAAADAGTVGTDADASADTDADANADAESPLMAASR